LSIKDYSTIYGGNDTQHNFLFLTAQVTKVSDNARIFTSLQIRTSLLMMSEWMKRIKPSENSI